MRTPSLDARRLVALHEARAYLRRKEALRTRPESAQPPTITARRTKTTTAQDHKPTPRSTPPTPRRARPHHQHSKPPKPPIASERFVRSELARAKRAARAADNQHAYNRLCREEGVREFEARLRRSLYGRIQMQHNDIAGLDEDDSPLLEIATQTELHSQAKALRDAKISSAAPVACESRGGAAAAPPAQPTAATAQTAATDPPPRPTSAPSPSFHLEGALGAQDVEALEDLAEADLAYLEMVRMKASVHSQTAGALATSNVEEALAESWQQLVMLRLQAQKLQLTQRRSPLRQEEMEAVESNLMAKTSRIAATLQMQLQEFSQTMAPRSGLQRDPLPRYTHTERLPRPPEPEGAAGNESRQRSASRSSTPSRSPKGRRIPSTSSSGGASPTWRRMPSIPSSNGLPGMPSSSGGCARRSSANNSMRANATSQSAVAPTKLQSGPRGSEIPFSPKRSAASASDLTSSAIHARAAAAGSGRATAASPRRHTSAERLRGTSLAAPRPAAAAIASGASKCTPKAREVVAAMHDEFASHKSATPGSDGEAGSGASCRKSPAVAGRTVDGRLAQQTAMLRARRERLRQQLLKTTREDA